MANPNWNSLEALIAQTVEHAAEYILDREMTQEEINAAVDALSEKIEDQLCSSVGDYFQTIDA